MPPSTSAHSAPKSKAKGWFSAEGSRRRVALACTRCRFSEENQAAKERKRQAKLDKEKFKTRNADKTRTFRGKIVEAFNLQRHRSDEPKPAHQRRSFSVEAECVAASSDYALPKPPAQFPSHPDTEDHFSVWHISQHQAQRGPSSSTSCPSQVSEHEDSTSAPVKSRAVDSVPAIEFSPLNALSSTSVIETPSVLVHDPTNHFTSGGAPPFAPHHPPPDFTALEPPPPFSINPAELQLPSHVDPARCPRLSHVRSAPFLRGQSSPRDGQELQVQSSLSPYSTAAVLDPPPMFQPTLPFLPFDPTPHSQSHSTVDPSSYLLDGLVDDLFREAKTNEGDF
ncbi:hypothetical protein JCM21900_004557 [Sporobolomyces salmonicolor]